MEITRVIHPIGQGAFYTETIFDNDNNKYFNVVYDCGSNTSNKNDSKSNNKSLIEYRIDCYLNLLKKQQKIKQKEKQEEKPKVDAVFISHFHDDHVNGLEYLLENANVQYLFIPQLSKALMIELIAYNIINNQESNISQLIVNIFKGTLDKDVKIIKVEDEILKNDSDNKKNIYSLKDNDIIHSGTKLYTDICESWLYIPYNPKISNDAKLTELYEKIKEEFNKGEEFSYENLSDMIKNCSLKDKLNKFREIYEDVFDISNHNSYSMPLFSGQEDPKTAKIEMQLIDKQHCCNIRCNIFKWEQICRDRNITNCLYTGDFDIEKHFSALKTFYNDLKLWETIHMIQVPHHCSRSNYCDELYLNIYTCFISVGIQNRYGHPNIDTLININEQVKYVNVVTEDINTMKIYKYKL